MIIATLGFAVPKAVYAYMGDSVIPTTLDFILGGIFVIGYLFHPFNLREILD